VTALVGCRSKLLEVEGTSSDFLTAGRQSFSVIFILTLMDDVF